LSRAIDFAFFHQRNADIAEVPCVIAALALRALPAETASKMAS
jgi:hypothetical protein